MNKLILCEGKTDAILLSYLPDAKKWVAVFKKFTERIGNQRR